MTVQKVYNRFMEFNRNWDDYSIKEKKQLNRLFKEELDAKPVKTFSL